jgi:RES domain-containing protein
LVYDEDLLHRLEDAPKGSRAGDAFRHMFADNSPLLANTGGSRWNPRDVAAIYASLDRDTALAEANHRISLEPFRPRAKRTLYRLHFELGNVLDLSSRKLLATVGVGDAELVELNFSACQIVGGAVAWLGHDGMIVPSARHSGVNLVVFPTLMSPDATLDVIDSEDIPYADSGTD